MKFAAAAAATMAAFTAVPGSEAFSAPVSVRGLRLATDSGAFCKAGQPLTYMKRARHAAVGDMKMELLGKRYWLWNVSEWALDKFIALTQVTGTVLYLHFVPNCHRVRYRVMYIPVAAHIQPAQR